MDKHTVTLRENGKGKWVVAHLFTQGTKGVVLGSWEFDTKEDAMADAQAKADAYGAVIESA